MKKKRMLLLDKENDKKLSKEWNIKIAGKAGRGEGLIFD